MCTEKQKDIFKHSLEVFIPKRPDDWKHILEIYDPDGKYWPGIKEFLDTPRKWEEEVKEGLLIYILLLLLL